MPPTNTTPTIFRGKARPSLYQTKSDDCPYPQTSPHPRSFGARHDHLCTRPKDFAAVPLPSNIATPTICRGKARPSLYQTKSDDCPYPQTSPHRRYVGARHDHLCTRSKDFAAVPLPSNIVTPTICRGTASTIFVPDQKTLPPCPECRQRIPHPRYLGARHPQSLYQTKRLRCRAPTLKHRHTDDM
ncbi:hypothetical protein MiSe_94790 [Microseira wollei NIES-4236]|uniref:Uncharacterized protein n=1 Tax=Microseira wollei NIES-4236 TaxID=2530354 RepID=A0AAV3XPJ0_9CYAN|nr:hypothetical protein MiSe_94790 [Microseira wollei NIES-4236]